MSERQDENKLKTLHDNPKKGRGRKKRIFMLFPAQPHGCKLKIWKTNNLLAPYDSKS